ncbi:MAG: TlpA family protein disulfide reductase [Phycisphaeraceae bacterium]|nr:TlpA family protein disulfide reductase [Phycisphaeraceae bacterium]
MLKWISLPMLAIACLSVTTARGQEQAAQPSDLIQQVRQAYADTQQYQATVQFTLTQKQPRVTSTQQFDIYVVFDRSGQSLVLDKPDMRVVIEGGRLKMRSDQLPSRYLDAEVPDPITLASIAQALPPALDPPMVDVILLVGDDPAGMLDTLRAGETPDTLIVDLPMGVMTLHVDAKTHLIQKAVVDINMQGQGAAGESVTLSYDYTIEKHNQPLDPQALAFEAGSDQAYATLQEMTQAGGGGTGSGGGGAAAGAENALEGQDAPLIETVTSTGQPYKLADEAAKVVVLDFWATWCGPCRAALPHIQAVSDWARDNDKSVAVYTVNVGETPADANAFWKEQGFTMPILMDQDNAISIAYGVQGIPQTVVIADGKVLHVHVGFDPNAEATLEAEIDAALAEAEAAASP